MVAPVALVASVEIGKDERRHDASWLGDAADERGVEDVTAEELARRSAAQLSPSTSNLTRSVRPTKKNDLTFLQEH